MFKHPQEIDFQHSQPSVLKHICRHKTLSQSSSLKISTTYEQHYQHEIIVDEFRGML